MGEFASAEEALVVIRQVVETIGDNDLDRPTPCPGWNVQSLADHLVDTIARLGVAAGVSTTARGGGSIDRNIRHVTQPILAEWALRGLADDVVFSGRTLPAHLALGILCLELIVHGWDFAVALGRSFEVSDTLAAHVLALAQQTLNAESRATAGFAPPVTVPGDASPLDQLVAFTGRDPRRLRRAMTRPTPSHKRIAATSPPTTSGETNRDHSPRSSC
jgi:uncharacterized protein (TIGR03086 family)